MSQSMQLGQRAAPDPHAHTTSSSCRAPLPVTHLSAAFCLCLCALPCWCAARLSLPSGSSPRAGHHPHHRLLDDFNADGSTVLLRPSAPVYCCDLDPAALGGVGTHTGSVAAADAGPAGSSNPEPSLPGFSAAPDVTLGAAGGVAGIGSRCGYRALGFGPPLHERPSSSSGPSSSQAAQAAAGAAAAAARPPLQLSVPLTSTLTGERDQPPEGVLLAI